jgi:coenzyme F420-reducing hydrogenase delta subunit
MSEELSKEPVLKETFIRVLRAPGTNRINSKYVLSRFQKQGILGVTRQMLEDINDE